jgi:hypothetical protein
MNQSESSLYIDQMHLAERELSAFIAAVTELFGAAQARLSAEDWLDESELVFSPPRFTSRDWRNVTIAASARLASQLNAALHRCRGSIDNPVTAVGLRRTKTLHTARDEGLDPLSVRFRTKLGRSSRCTRKV